MLIFPYDFSTGEKKPGLSNRAKATENYFFFFGKPAFIFVYAFADTVDFAFDLLVPAFLRAFMFAYNPFLAITSPKSTLIWFVTCKLFPHLHNLLVI